MLEPVAPLARSPRRVAHIAARAQHEEQHDLHEEPRPATSLLARSALRLLVFIPSIALGLAGAVIALLRGGTARSAVVEVL